jgi:ABC-type Fe3+-hydroxamate transport system substrate-binding protein
MIQGPRRIVCLTEEPTEVLYALGEQERIVGISGFTVRPPRARKGEPGLSRDAGGISRRRAPRQGGRGRRHAPGTVRARRDGQ